MRRNQKILNRARSWLQDWLFSRFCLFWKDLQTNCSWFKQINAAVANGRVIIYYNPEQSKETMLEFSKGTRNVLELHKIFEYSKGNVKLSETFSKNLSADLKRSEAKIFKIIQLG